MIGGLAAMSLAAAAPLAAQQAETPPAPAEQREGGGLEGEAIGYLAVPVLLVLVLLAGLLIGGEDEDMSLTPG